MNADDLHALLAAGPVLADGGMGTSLIDRGAPVDACFEEMNVSDPALVESVHRTFVEAGARLVLTNTFGGNRFRLDRYGHADRVAGYAHAAVVVARRAGAELVAGSMGPLGVRLAPYGRVTPIEAFDAYREQAAALADAGVDLLVIETQTDLREMEQALAGARDAAPELAVAVSATYTKDDRTLLGSTPDQVGARLAELGADAIGVNCGEGPAQVLRVVRAMLPYTGGLPIMARPNAGGPAEVGGRFVYPATPDYVGELAHALMDEGVAVVGGCCGTGPAHTAAIATALQERGSHDRIELPGPAVGSASAAEAAAPAAPPTALQRKLEQGSFVIAVEMEPPRSFNAATLVVAAGTLRDAGADVIDVADSPMAKMRMSAWAACRLVQEQVGIETVLHFPTRGRNLLRLQGDLLGAHALGIRNLFICVGDPVTIGDYPQGSNNVDVTATGLLALITDDFNRGRDRAGSSIGEPTSFFVGAAASPDAASIESDTSDGVAAPHGAAAPAAARGGAAFNHELRLLKRKAEVGASFFLTQPVYEAGVIERLRSAYERANGEPLSVPILAGVLPLISSRHAEFLHNEVPGIRVPDAARERMRKAGDDAWREGLAMAAELVDGIRAAGAAGIYVMPQFGRYDLAAEVVEAART